MRYYARRRSFATPSVYLAGGKPLEGMDASGSSELSASVATKAENLWRTADGCVCKRPGFRLKEQLEIPGQVKQEKYFAGQRFIYYVTAAGTGKLRRYRNGVAEDRTVAQPLTMLQFQGRLLILTPGEWLVIEDTGAVQAVRSGGIATVTELWSKTATFAWSLSQSLVTVPLIRSGSSPTGKGLNVQPPNALTPLLQESFVYTESHRDAKHNRFCLQHSPEIMGSLPTNADGTHSDISEADQATRKNTLSLSAKLEVRLLKTDAYGNTTDYWANRSWSYLDNISHDDAAFWVQNIQNAALAYDGDDNVRITYYYDLSAAKKRAAQILAATSYTLYGVGGLKDRLFAAAGNQIYYSAMDDALYFSLQQQLSPDAGDTDIRILSGEDTVLTVLADNGAWRITGGAESEVGEYALDAYFTVSAKLPSPAPVGDKCIIAGGELLFYTAEGLCAITPSGVLDERCVQNRSRRLEGVLKEETPEDIRLYTWKDWILLVGKKGVYLLDLHRRIRVSDDAYSTHCYEGYFWPDISVDCFTEGEALSFYHEGNLYTFTEGDKEEDYHDELLVDGVLQKANIAVLWQSGRLGGSVQYCGRFFALSVHCKGRTSMDISCDSETGWKLLHKADGQFGAFWYNRLYYGQWNYRTSPHFVRRFLLPLYHKRGLWLRLENSIMDQPFRLETFILEYK